MSNKNKSRRRAPASQARASQARTSQASTSQAAAGQDGDISQAEADAIVRDVLSKLWEGVASGDPLRAELETATCMGLPPRPPPLPSAYTRPYTLDTERDTVRLTAPGTGKGPVTTPHRRSARTAHSRARAVV